MTTRLFSLLFLSCLFFWPLPSQSGGIVQEFHQTNYYQESSNALSTELSSNKKKRGSKKYCDPQQRGFTEAVRLSFDSSNRIVTVAWSVHAHNGKTPFRYLIYRRSVGSDTWELVGSVEGDVSQFSDANTENDQAYEYKVVALYQSDDQLTAIPYQQSEISNKELAFGCQSTPTSPNFGLFFFLCLLLPFFFRRHLIHTSNTP